jgi:4-amino-4-deoxy-L-arabinose transferase-like glycosyltransferase
MKSSSQTRDEACLWIWAAVRLVTGAGVGLGVDEAHYALYGQSLALSYFDHPPLVGWVLGLFQMAFGTADWVIRLPAVLAGTATSLLLSRLLRATGFSDFAVRVGLVALQVSPLFAGLSMIFLPDTLVLLIAVWITWILFRESQSTSSWNWMQLGLAMGLLGLSKYTAVFVAAGLLLILIVERKKWRLPPVAVLGSVSLAALLISPVLIWNIENDWISFRYQTSHVIGDGPLDINIPIRSLVAQWVGYGLFLVPLAWITLARKSSLPWQDPRARLRLWVLCLVGPSQLFFLYSSLRQDVLPHWALMVHTLVIAAGWTWYIDFAKPTHHRWRWALMFHVGLLTVALLELNFRFIPYPDSQTPYGDVLGWQQIKVRATQILETKGHPSRDDQVAIAVTNWTTGSRANFYLQDLGPVFVLDDREDQFDIWEKAKPKPTQLLLISPKGFPPLEHAAILRCPRWEYLEEMKISAKTFWGFSFEVNDVTFRWCQDFNWSVPLESGPPMYRARGGLGTQPGQEQ